MRTTLTLDDSAFAAASNYARARALKLGEAVSELIAQALTPPEQQALRLRRNGELLVFDVPVDAPVMTALQVKASLEDDA